MTPVFGWLKTIHALNCRTIVIRKKKENNKLSFSLIVVTCSKNICYMICFALEAYIHSAVREFHTIYATPEFITMFPEAQYWYLP
jgi:hypothetical protein